MWLCTTLGFYSVVCPRLDKHDRLSGPDTRYRMVRARSRQHLVNLIEKFKNDLSEYRILCDTGNDYPYRIIVPVNVWSRIIVELDAEIDYGNFKSACSKSTRVGPAYASFLMTVWSAGLKLMPQRRSKKQMAEYLRYDDDPHDPDADGVAV